MIVVMIVMMMSNGPMMVMMMRLPQQGISARSKCATDDTCDDYDDDHEVPLWISARSKCNYPLYERGECNEVDQKCLFKKHFFYSFQ